MHARTHEFLQVSVYVRFCRIRQGPSRLFKVLQGALGFFKLLQGASSYFKILQGSSPSVWSFLMSSLQVSNMTSIASRDGNKYNSWKLDRPSNVQFSPALYLNHNSHDKQLDFHNCTKLKIRNCSQFSVKRQYLSQSVSTTGVSLFV